MNLTTLIERNETGILAHEETDLLAMDWEIQSSGQDWPEDQSWEEGY